MLKSILLLSTPSLRSKMWPFISKSCLLDHKAWKIQNSISFQHPSVLIVLAGSITLVSMCFSMYCYLYNTQTGCLRLLRELTFNKKEWKIGQVQTCWERFTYPIFYPFAFSRVRIFVQQIEFLVVSQVQDTRTTPVVYTVSL